MSTLSEISLYTHHAVFCMHIEHLLDVMAIVDEVLIDSGYVRAVSWNVKVNAIQLIYWKFVTRITVYMYMEIIFASCLKGRK